MEERTLVSHILDAARKVLSTPMNVPSVEQVELRTDAPIGSQQMVLLYLELFLVTVLQNEAKPDVSSDHRDVCKSGGTFGDAGEAVTGDHGVYGVSDL